MTEEADNNIDTLIELTADVVSAYVSNNPIPVGDLHSRHNIRIAIDLTERYAKPMRPVGRSPCGSD